MKQVTTCKDLKRANFRLIEQELYHYTERRKMLEEMRLDIIESGGQPEIPVYCGPGDQTARKAIKLRTSVAIYETERRLKAIEDALKVTERIEPEKYKLVKLKYFEQRLTNQGIMEELNISATTFYRWRQEFIQTIAERLGWEVE